MDTRMEGTGCPPCSSAPNLTQKALLPDDSELIRVNFFKTPLKGVDFTSCRLQAPTLSLGGPELRGAEVTLFQAAELAGQMGVIIKG